MKVTLNTKKLKDCLNYITKISVSGKKSGASPIYTQVQLSFKSNQLTLTSYDSSYGVQIIYGEVICEDSIYHIDAEGLSHITRYSDEEELIFDFKDTKVVVTDGTSSYKFSYFITESPLSYIFDTLGDLSDVILTTTASEFIRVFKFLEPCIAKDAARPFLNGIQFDGSFIATDGNICGVYSHKDKQEDSVFFISEGLDLLTSLPEEKDMLIHKSGNVNVILCDNIKIITPQMVGSFPNYTKIVDATSTYPYEFAIEKSKLQKISEKLVPFADSHQRLVASAVFTPEGTLQLSATSEGTKEGSETLSSIQSISPSENIEFHLNIRLLASLVKSISTELIYLRYSENTKTPLVITDKGQYSHFLSVYSYIKNS
jgi:DNA polymerase III sliding clamp (beta) subunit (PCNA family)